MVTQYITYEEAFNTLGVKVFKDSWSSDELESYIYKNLYYENEFLEPSNDKCVGFINNNDVLCIRDSVVSFFYKLN